LYMQQPEMLKATLHSQHDKLSSYSPFVSNFGLANLYNLNYTIKTYYFFLLQGISRQAFDCILALAAYRQLLKRNFQKDVIWAVLRSLAKKIKKHALVYYFGL
jgi:hypothetical protein